MGRTLIGGSAVASSTASSSSSSASSGDGYITAQPKRDNRIEGLPLICVGGTTDSAANTSRLGISVIDSLGRMVTEQSYMGTFGGGDFHAASYYSSTYQTGAANGYAGAQYYDEHLYANQNPSTSNWHSNASQGAQGWNWTGYSRLGGRSIEFDLDYATRCAYYRPRGYNASYSGGYASTYGDSSCLDSGSWIGGEGTRQDHSLVKIYNEDALCIYRNARTDFAHWPTPRRTRPLDPNDEVDWWDYAPSDYQAAVSKAAAQARYMYGSRFSYNENLNRLVFITGYSTYTTNTYCLIWDGATDKNLWDTSLKDWFEAATATNLGTITSGFIDFSNSYDDHGAKCWLANDGKTIISWKRSSSNYCYVVDTRPESAGAVTAQARNPGGSTTSYSYAQGQQVHTHEGYTSWDNKWLWLGWVYYYYHCGLIGRAFSLDNTDITVQYSNTDSSHNALISPIGKSGFMISQTNNMSGTQGYATIYDFSDTKEAYESNGNSGFHYKMNQRNYTTLQSTYSAGSVEEISSPNTFDRAHGMVWRTNLSINGTLDATRSTWQMLNHLKQSLQVPTNYAGFRPLGYWYRTLPDGTSNLAGDMY